MKVQEIDINKVIPYWQNPRDNEKTVERLCISIKEYGFNVPLVVNKDMVIITGHARLKAAKKLGLKTVPCNIVDLTDEQAKKYRIADNKIQELTDWKEEELFKELREIGDKMELVNMGFSLDDIDEIVGSMEQTIEQIEPPTLEPVTASNPVVTGSTEPVAAMPMATIEATNYDDEKERKKLEELLKKRELELSGRFVKESYEEHAKDNLIRCPHCGESFVVRGLTK